MRAGVHFSKKLLTIILFAVSTIILLYFPSLGADAVVNGQNGKIVFEKNNNGYSEFTTVNQDGSGITTLNQPTGMIKSSPVWSPNGQHLFYARSQAPGIGNSAIYIANQDGTNERRVGPYGVGGSISVSPDGTLLAIADNQNDCIGIMSIDDGTYSCIVSNLTSKIVWSPSGNTLIYERSGAVISLDIDSGVEKQLTFHAGFSYPVSWSPDGSTIAYISTLHPSGNDGSEFRLYFMNPDGSGRTGFDDSIIGRPSIDIYDASFSPDGTKLVYSYRESATNTTTIRVTAGHLVTGATTIVATTALSQSSVDWQSLANSVATTTPQPTPSTSAIYRFWSPLVRHHLLTADVNEKNYLQSHYPSSIWSFEGTAFGVKATTNCSADESVYRFYSEVLKTHLYTMDENEKAYLLNNYPPSVWRYEGIAYCAGSLQNRDTQPVYRFYSEVLKSHLYTIDENEAQFLIDTYDDSVWRYEGIAYYAYPKN